MGSLGLFIRIGGAQFTAKSWQELWRITGTRLGFSSAYHPQTQGVVEQTNAVVSQTLRCLIHDSKNVKKWEILLPTVEMAINSSPNQSTGFRPFFLNYGYEPVMPIQLLKGDDSTKIESVASFIQRVTSDWNLARENLQRSVGLQQKYYDQKHRDIHYNVGGLGIAVSPKFEDEGNPCKAAAKVCRALQGNSDNWAAGIQAPPTRELENTPCVSCVTSEGLEDCKLTRGPANSVGCP